MIPQETVKKPLSRKKAAQYAVLHSIFKATTQKLISHLKGRGRNSFEPVCIKAETLNGSTGDSRNYHINFVSGLPIGKAISAIDLGNSVCSIRARFGFARYKGNIHKLCIEKLYNHFIVEEKMEAGADGKKHRVCIPVFSLLAD
jgi:hypothetical protein